MRTTTPSQHPLVVAVILLSALTLILLLAIPGTGDRQTPGMESGVLRIGGPHWGTAPTPFGLDHELATALAGDLGLRLNVNMSRSDRQVLHLMNNGAIDIAAWGLAATDTPKGTTIRAPAYGEVTFQLVYRRGDRRPRDMTQIGDGPVHIVESAEMSAIRKEIATTHTELRWISHTNLDVADLVALVWGKSARYALIRSDLLAYFRRFYPEVKVAFDATGAYPVSWALRDGLDHPLDTAIRRFFERIHADGTLAQLRDRYYGHLDRLDYVSLRRFLRHRSERLPRYRGMLERVAEETGLDWRLLAAMAYQESLWEPDAVSPTGVKGLMMLTRATASQMGIQDRSDPLLSLQGGARYFLVVKRKIPERIPEPDRTWLTLAAYNVGFGHMEDARILTQRGGADPDKWNDVKRHLPLLADEAWYPTTRYGFARGHEPVQYVERIRNFHELLSWPSPAEPRRTADASDDRANPKAF